MELRIPNHISDFPLLWRQHKQASLSTKNPVLVEISFSSASLATSELKTLKYAPKEVMEWTGDAMQQLQQLGKTYVPARGRHAGFSTLQKINSLNDH